jgi:uncharacterized protein (TIGR01777 family)
MHILIVGGTGFIGSYLCREFLKQGHAISVLTRTPEAPSTLPSAVKRIGEFDTRTSYDVIINLAGAPLNKPRWNTRIKQIIYDSRIHTTQKIIDYIQAASIKPQLLISGSAIGFYGNGQNVVFTESSPPADAGFTHRLCADWEKVALTASTFGTRVCTIRTGLVLGKGGGVLAAMLPAFKWGLGAQLGDGLQWMSWVHMDDLIGMINYLITHPALIGPVNLTAPHPVTHLTFIQTLAKTLHRPCFLKLSPPLVKLIFGEMGETLLLQGQKVIPDKMIEAGYEFQFPYLDIALKNILRHA